MATWALAKAKAQLSELVDKAVHHEPQQITKHGKPVAVVVSIEDWPQAKRPVPQSQRSMAQFFRDSPLRGSNIDLRRSTSKARQVNL